MVRGRDQNQLERLPLAEVTVQLTLESKVLVKGQGRRLGKQKGLGLPGKNVLVPRCFEQVLLGLPL